MYLVSEFTGRLYGLAERAGRRFTVEHVAYKRVLKIKIKSKVKHLTDERFLKDKVKDLADKHVKMIKLKIWLINMS